MYIFHEILLTWHGEVVAENQLMKWKSWTNQKKSFESSTFTIRECTLSTGWVLHTPKANFTHKNQYVLPFRSHMAVNRWLRQFNKNSSPSLLKRSARKEGYTHLRFLHFPADRSALKPISASQRVFPWDRGECGECHGELQKFHMFGSHHH